MGLPSVPSCHWPDGPMAQPADGVTAGHSMPNESKKKKKIVFISFARPWVYNTIWASHKHDLCKIICFTITKKQVP